jgi:ATP-dependent Lon protease
MPKNSSAFLTDRFGLITDYLAAAFHYQLKHSNRYEEVNKRLKLGSAVEGCDEKGIKKTLCAMLKILTRPILPRTRSSTSTLPTRSNAGVVSFPP